MQSVVIQYDIKDGRLNNLLGWKLYKMGVWWYFFIHISPFYGYEDASFAYFGAIEVIALRGQSDVLGANHLLHLPLTPMGKWIV